MCVFLLLPYKVAGRDKMNIFEQEGSQRVLGHRKHEGLCHLGYILWGWGGRFKEGHWRELLAATAQQKCRDRSAGTQSDSRFAGSPAAIIWLKWLLMLFCPWSWNSSVAGIWWTPPTAPFPKLHHTKDGTQRTAGRWGSNMEKHSSSSCS